MTEQCSDVSECPLVLITWQDSHQAAPGWRYLSDLGPSHPVKCYSVGWLLDDGNDAKRLCQSMGDPTDNDDVQTSGIIVIPARCIVSVERLVEKEASTTSSVMASCDQEAV